MRARTFPLLLRLLLLLTVSITFAHLDVCHSDPRHMLQPTACKPTEHLLHVPTIGGNPNHALHDWLWIIAHYLRNCLTPQHTIVLNEPKQNLSLCSSPDETHMQSAGATPHWGICIFDIVARSLNVSYTLFYSGQREWPVGSENFTGSTTCPQHSWLGIKPSSYGTDGFAIQYGHYRGLNYFSRECGNRVNCNGSALIQLSDGHKTAALHTIRSSVRSFFNIPNRNGSSPVRILLYDRADARRRRWVNSFPIFHRLANDNRVVVHYLRRSPKTMRAQVELYAWADIVIGPHGAAMANSIFMEPGSEVVEIWNYCDSNVKRSRFRLRAWTGWHTYLLGINLGYVQCHRAEGRLMQPHELLVNKMGGITHGPQKVRVEDVFEFVEPAIKRQVARLEDLRDGRIEEEEEPSKVVEVMESVVSDIRVKWVSRVGLLLFGPACMLILISHRRVGTSKMGRRSTSRK